MEFGSTFVLAATPEYEEGGSRNGVSRATSFKQRLRSLSISASTTCVVHLLDPSTSQSLPEPERARWKEQCMRQSNGFALVYDARNPETFRAANLIYEECCLLNKPIVLCANFSDKLDDEAVPYASVLAWGRAHAIPVLRASAKTGDQVDEVFIRLTRLAHRSGRDYTFTILGAARVGKTSLAMRFCYNSDLAPDVVAPDQGPYTRKIAIHSRLPTEPQASTSTRPPMEPQASASTLPPMEPQAGTSTHPPAEPRASTSTRPNKLRKKRSMSLSATQSRGTSMELRKSITDPPPLPTLSGARSMVDMRQEAQLSQGASRGHLPLETSPQSLSPLSPTTRHRKMDCNVVLLNLGSLAPDDPNTSAVARGLRGRPPICPECGARCRGGPRCAFCGAPVSAFADIRPPPAAEEYALFQRFQTVSWSVSDSDDFLTPPSGHTSLTIFCIDISSSVMEPHNTRYEHILWRRAHGRSAEEHISRLQCMQDAVLLHLARLRQHYPDRKVATLLVTGDVDVSFSGLYASHRIRNAHGYIRTMKQGLIYGEDLVSPYCKSIERGYDALVRQVEVLQPSASDDNALGAAIAVALGLAKGHLRQGGTATEVLICSQNAANVGLGNRSPFFREAGDEFYVQAKETAAECAVTFSTLSVTRDGPDVDVLANLARSTGGCVSALDEPKLHLLVEPRRPGTKRTIARDVEAKLFLPRGWQFESDDPRPQVMYDDDCSIATVRVPQVADDTVLSFAFHLTPHLPLPSPDAQFVLQAQIQYTNPAHDTMLRILHVRAPTTRARAQAELAARCDVLALHALRMTAVRAAPLLANGNWSEGRALRDSLASARRLLEGTGEAEKFLAECERLDCELEAAFDGSACFRPGVGGAAYDYLLGAFRRLSELPLSAVSSTTPIVSRKRRQSVTSKRSIKWR